MGLGLMSLFASRRPSLDTHHRGCPAGRGLRTRLSFENLEDRLVLAAPASLSIPLDFSNVRVADTTAGQILRADVALPGQATATPVDITAITQVLPNVDCPVLSLHLGPINLNVLGLHVDTSAICLDVTATDNGGILGDLLCSLSGPLTLGGILGELTTLGGSGTDLVGGLLTQVETVLDSVLGQAGTVTDLLGGHNGGVCDILNLELGPVDLSVLGVNVSLDNCEGGPVTVDVTADPTGGLLGQVLCGIADGLDLGGLNLGGVLDRVGDVLDRLFDVADRLEQVGDNLIHQVDNAIDKLERVVDRVSDLKSLDKVIKELDKVIDRLDRVIDHLPT